MIKKALAAALVLVMPFATGGQDKEKKTYELVYQDVQLLKQQYLRLEKKVDAAADGIKLVQDQVR